MKKVDFHSHNCESSKCAKQTLEESITNAIKNNIDTLAITNHDFITDLSNLKRKDINLITGVEISSYIYIDEKRHNLHILGLNLKVDDYEKYNEILALKNNISEDDKDIVYTINLIHELGGVASWAHPARFVQNEDIINKITKKLKEFKLDALEILHPDNVKLGKVEFLMSLVNRYNLKTTIGSDNHHVEDEYFRFTVTSETYNAVFKKLIVF